MHRQVWYRLSIEERFDDFLGRSLELAKDRIASGTSGEGEGIKGEFAPLRTVIAKIDSKSGLAARVSRSFDQPTGNDVLLVLAFGIFAAENTELFHVDTMIERRARWVATLRAARSPDETS